MIKQSWLTLQKKIGVSLSDYLSENLKRFLDCKEYELRQNVFETIQSSATCPLVAYEMIIDKGTVTLEIPAELLQSLTGLFCKRPTQIARKAGPLTLTEQFIGKKICENVCQSLQVQYEKATLKKVCEDLNEIYSFYPDDMIQTVLFTFKLDRAPLGQVALHYLCADTVESAIGVS